MNNRGKRKAIPVSEFKKEKIEAALIRIPDKVLIKNRSFIGYREF